MPVDAPLDISPGLQGSDQAGCAWAVGDNRTSDHPDRSGRFRHVSTLTVVGLGGFGSVLFSHHAGLFCKE